MKIYIVDDMFEVPDFGLPRCESLRNLVDFVCAQEESYPSFRGTTTDGPKGEDQFRAIVDAAGAVSTTVVRCASPTQGNAIRRTSIPL